MLSALSSDDSNCYIVRLVEVYDRSGRVYMILELMEGGKLTYIIQKADGNYSEAFCKYSLYCVVRGLLSMHRKSILHRDIKSDNILVSRVDAAAIKICDLGYAVFL